MRIGNGFQDRGASAKPSTVMNRFNNPPYMKLPSGRYHRASFRTYDILLHNPIKKSSDFFEREQVYERNMPSFKRFSGRHIFRMNQCLRLSVLLRFDCDCFLPSAALTAADFFKSDVLPRGREFSFFASLPRAD